MISDVILKANKLSTPDRPLAGRECFVVRVRVAGGFWRRGAETPCAVNWDERITEIREGSWSYVAEYIGKAPGTRITVFVSGLYSTYGFILCNSKLIYDGGV